MAPTRIRPHPHQTLHAPSNHHRTNTSDLDSDYPSTTPFQYHHHHQQQQQQALSAASPPKRTNSQLNLAVLRRHNPLITRILSSAPFAVVYLFNAAAQAWEKSGVEGTLFVVQLAPRPTPYAAYAPSQQERYAVIVLNRRGLENFELELRREEDVEITDQYIIVQGSKRGGEGGYGTDGAGDPGGEDAVDIYGLWVFTEPVPSSTAETRMIMARLIQECAMVAERTEMSVSEDREQPLNQSVAAPGGIRDEGQYQGRGAGMRPGAYPPQTFADGSLGHAAGFNGRAPMSGDVIGDLFQRAKENYHSQG